MNLTPLYGQRHGGSHFLEVVSALKNNDNNNKSLVESVIYAIIAHKHQYI